MFFRQEDLLNQIDSLISTMDEDVRKQKKRTLIVGSRRKNQNFLNQTQIQLGKETKVLPIDQTLSTRVNSALSLQITSLVKLQNRPRQQFKPV